MLTVAIVGFWNPYPVMNFIEDNSNYKTSKTVAKGRDDFHLLLSYYVYVRNHYIVDKL